MKILIFNSLLLLLRWLKGGKTEAKNGLTSLLFIYFITANKYQFCISVIVYINTNNRYWL